MQSKPLEATWLWRTGRSVGRTIYACPPGSSYRHGEVLIGMMDSPELAAEAVKAHNVRWQRPASDGLRVMGGCLHNEGTPARWCPNPTAGYLVVTYEQRGGVEKTDRLPCCAEHGPEKAAEPHGKHFRGTVVWEPNR